MSSVVAMILNDAVLFGRQVVRSRHTLVFVPSMQGTGFA